jgi:hypothetical protein
MVNERKYEKYFMEANKKASADWECMEGTFQDILWYDNRFNAEAPNLIAYGLRYGTGTEGAGTFVQYPDHEEPDLPHAHAFAEHFIYLGLDPDHPDDLGGTFEIWLGTGEEAECYTITKPTCVFMPPNTVHLPILYKEVHKPFGSFVVLNSPMRALYLVDKLPPGFNSETAIDKGAIKQTSGAGKYAKCIIERDPNETDYFPSHTGKSHLIIRQDIRKHKEATNTIEANLIYGAGIGWGCGDIMQYPNYQAPSLPHKHAWAENYCFLGSDLHHPNDLGGTVEFWIGEGEEAEQYIISKPTVILVPKNTVHLPMYVREVHNPFLAITVLDTPLAAELPVGNFPPGFQHIIKPA